MTPNPILKVLSVLSQNRVRYLLMGGQACVFYGAAQFSRDTDIVVLAAPANMDRLKAALNAPQAECVAVPPFEPQYLARGHAVDFRCREPETDGMRIDVMSVLRGVAPFDGLWEPRATLEDRQGTHIELISLPDLGRAKKTQRDKDWPMLRRLVETHLVQHQAQPTAAQIRFWLEECAPPPGSWNWRNFTPTKPLNSSPRARCCLGPYARKRVRSPKPSRPKSNGNAQPIAPTGLR